MYFQIMANITSRYVRDAVKLKVHSEKMIGLTKNSHYRSALLDEHIYLNIIIGEENWTLHHMHREGKSCSEHISDRLILISSFNYL